MIAVRAEAKIFKRLTGVRAVMIEIKRTLSIIPANTEVIPSPKAGPEAGTDSRKKEATVVPENKSKIKEFLVTTITTSSSNNKFLCKMGK